MNIGLLMNTNTTLNSLCMLDAFPILSPNSIKLESPDLLRFLSLSLPFSKVVALPGLNIKQDDAVVVTIVSQYYASEIPSCLLSHIDEACQIEGVYIVLHVLLASFPCTVLKQTYMYPFQQY